MVDPYIGKYYCIILQYGKNDDGYWTGEDVVIHIQDTHTTFIKLHRDCITLYFTRNSKNHRKIATNALKALRLNLKYGGENTPILCDG